MTFQQHIKIKTISRLYAGSVHVAGLGGFGHCQLHISPQLRNAIRKYVACYPLQNTLSSKSTKKVEIIIVILDEWKGPSLFKADENSALLHLQ